MLDSAFHKVIRSPQSRRRERRSDNKTWSYTGRFIFGFAMIEYQVNELFQQLLGIDLSLMKQENDDSKKLAYDATVLLTYALDLRRKANLIQTILNDRGINEIKMFKRIHALHDLRNVIAHWPFDEEADQSGIFCDYMNAVGDTSYQKHETGGKDNSITYEELDLYDIEASEIFEKLRKLTESATPIIGPSEDLRRAMIEEAIKASDNVVRFPLSLRHDDTDNPE